MRDGVEEPGSAPNPLETGFLPLLWPRMPIAPREEPSAAAFQVSTANGAYTEGSPSTWSIFGDLAGNASQVVVPCCLSVFHKLVCVVFGLIELWQDSDQYTVNFLHSNFLRTIGIAHFYCTSLYLFWDRNSLCSLN
jgi:hypothetical protein